MFFKFSIIRVSRNKCCWAESSFWDHIHKHTVYCSLLLSLLKMKSLTGNFKIRIGRYLEMFKNPTVVCYHGWFAIYRIFCYFLDSEGLLLKLVIIGWSSSAISRPFCLFLCLCHVQVSFCIVWPLLSAGINRWHCNPSFSLLVKTASIL